ncbi:hypothetical protein [uncultured Gammaproteobacteria bacterium]|nr:hypothetical protein [uncultured Gammaproteobacteria bacterium]CAC9558959.1 hypothetical protein [uncultured Gammaproteobacteria bacterium]CAC9561301.1 hypothetical protein [uncultured Gammaproteobacteria bacterium]
MLFLRKKCVSQNGNLKIESSALKSQFFKDFKLVEFLFYK